MRRVRDQGTSFTGETSSPSWQLPQRTLYCPTTEDAEIGLLRRSVRRPKARSKQSARRTELWLLGDRVFLKYTSSCGQLLQCDPALFCANLTVNMLRRQVELNSQRVTWVERLGYKLSDCVLSSMKYADIVGAQCREACICFSSHTQLHDGSCLTFKIWPMNG